MAPEVPSSAQPEMLMPPPSLERSETPDLDSLTDEELEALLADVRKQQRHHQDEWDRLTVRAREITRARKRNGVGRAVRG